MGIDIRAKGANGEREIADDLNACLYIVRNELGLPVLEKPQVQRNQNQTAVGGCDLVGTYDLAIEVKRHETLSINTWWAQCVKSAAELKKQPVLLFRQNAKPGQRTKWRCIMLAEIPVTASVVMPCRVEVEYEDFKAYFRLLARKNLQAENPGLEGNSGGVPLPPHLRAVGA